MIRRDAKGRFRRKLREEMSALEIFALDVLGPSNERLAREIAAALVDDRAFFGAMEWVANPDKIG